MGLLSDGIVEGLVPDDIVEGLVIACIIVRRVRTVCDCIAYRGL